MDFKNIKLFFDKIIFSIKNIYNLYFFNFTNIIRYSLLKKLINYILKYNFHYYLFIFLIKIIFFLKIIINLFYDKIMKINKK